MRKVSSFLTAAVMVLLATSLPIRAQEATRTINIGRDCIVGGRQVERGRYSLKFAEGRSGELTLWRGNREVASAAYTISELERPAPDNVVIYRMADDGTLTISRIEFKGKTFSLVISRT